MPFATRDDVRLYWKLDGSEGAPALVLLNSIATDMTVWDACVRHLVPVFRCLRMDPRGHGASDAPEGDYDMPMLAADVAAVMDAAGVEHAFVAGVSLGGMVAMQLALDRPERVDALALICTSATMDSSVWEARLTAVREGGMAAIADVVMGRLLSPGFARAHPAIEQGIRRALLAQPAHGYAGAGAAIRDIAVYERLGGVAQSTLVVGGDRDVSTPFAEHGRRVVGIIPGAEFAHLDAGHLAQVEQPAALAALLRRFFLPRPALDAAADALFEAGLANRRRVLGDAWVDRALAGRTPFNADFQSMITRSAWQEVWSRPGLDDTTRRLLVLAITAALGRWEEFQLHVRAGLSQGGFGVEELKEVLMQLAVYAGVPAANTGFAEAERILAEIEARV
ncbi:MAG TPA: 3-oxoadipate enol-lactonase [Sphingomonas sp.]|jgi:3-oxoadipate enol-lactonase/4-carboxymuconolactone decarboxylase